MNSNNQSSVTTAESLDVVAGSLRRLIDGQGLPSFRDSALGRLTAALGHLNGLTDQVQRRAALEGLGLLASAVLVTRIQDSLSAEREAVRLVAAAKRPR